MRGQVEGHTDKLPWAPGPRLLLKALGKGLLAAGQPLETSAPKALRSRNVGSFVFDKDPIGMQVSLNMT